MKKDFKRGLFSSEFAAMERRLSRYERRRSWFKDDDFIKDLESDSVDTEVLDEELQALEASEAKSWRFSLHRFLESNPVQIALCVLALIDTGVVIAEILLDINVIRMQSEVTSEKLEVTMNFLRRTYASELNGYTGDDVFYIIDRLEQQQHSNSTSPSSSSSSSSSPRHKRFAASAMIQASDRKQYIDSGGGPAPSSRGQPVTGPGPARGHRTGAGRSKRQFHRISVRQAMDGGESRTDRDLRRKTASTTTTTTTSSSSRSSSSSTASYSRSRSPHAAESAHSDKSHVAHELLELTHILHYLSIAILGVFVVQVILTVTALGMEFFRRKMEIFDAIIVIASFVLDLVFVKGMTNVKGDETIAVIVIFLLWRILRIINGMMLTSKKRQEFRIKLQKRARRKTEKRIECLLEDKEWQERELSNLKSLCLNKGASEEELRLCKPRRRSVFHKLTTSTGLSSIASLSLGLSLSGPLVTKNQLPSFPILPRSCRTSLAGTTTTGTKSTRSSSTSLEPTAPWTGRCVGAGDQDTCAVDPDNRCAAPFYHSNNGNNNNSNRALSYLSSRSNTCEEETEEEEEEEEEEEVEEGEEGYVGMGPINDSADDESNFRTDHGSMTDTGVASERESAAGGQQQQQQQRHATGLSAGDSDAELASDGGGGDGTRLEDPDAGSSG